ncbi:MAG: T9SS type A sorting domain-containing protein, partial [Bacteroidota bacterium]
VPETSRIDLTPAQTITIDSANIKIPFDTAKLTYVNLVNFYSVMPSSQWYYSGNFDPYDCNSFTISANWLHPSLGVLAVPDGTTLFEIQFVSKGGNCPLNFCINEFTDINYDFISTIPTNGAVNMATVTWSGAVSPDWATTGNWDLNIVPGVSYNAIIPAGATNMPVVNATPGSPAVCVDLTINSGATVTIAAGKALTVKGILTNGSNPGIILNSDATGTGSLIFNNTGVNGIVQRYVSAWGDASHGWHLLSAPVTAQPFQPTFVSSPPGSSEDFYLWSETTALWINSKSGTSPYTFNPVFGTNFELGKGYLVAYGSAGAKTFSGTLNFSDVSKPGLTNTPGPLYVNGFTSGWNLIGNPFTSPITWYTGWTHSTNIGAVAKIWNESGASYTDITAGGIIPATQGFMVEVTAGTPPGPWTGSLTIPAKSRTHSATAWYKSSGNPSVKLVAHDLAGQTAQESVIIFNTQATPGYDQEFDSHFLPGYAPQFYSVDGTDHLSTNVLPELNGQTVVPFNFIKTDGSDYTIEAAQIDNFSSQVLLTDLKTNQTQNLIENPVYSFTASVHDEPARFLLSFGHVGIHEETKNNGIYSYENNLYLENPGKAILEIYSLTGQKLMTEEINSTELYTTSINYPPGYYIVRLVRGSKVVVTKVFIRS